MGEQAQVRLIRERAGLTQRQLAERSGVAQPNIAAYERDARRPSPAMLQRLASAARPRPSVVLAEQRSAVEELLREHHASSARVFGSVARGTDRPGSDLDLLVAFDASASLFDIVGLGHDLEDLLGVEVDVVSEGGLRPKHARIREEAVPL
ncbi:nucleotidyltransferase domain-containing protein [Agrococcus sp. KRD186]|uniref:nucleotidyltransferase domain-containing protein n=1 Tax=Agrococcus sp. KRD186 TaxID=2729730 RepID=UPI0019D0FAB8|nr:nucleotidyltransferase domain-containing protein [Agrococcus sp. KRD186]